MPRPKKSSNLPKRVTLQDIADAAGVHVMTVSNALGDTRSVAPETKERVRQIARELNYTPNALARALVAGKTGVIAIISGPISEPYYASMVHNLKEHLDADGYQFTLLQKPHEVIDLIQSTGSVAVDGAIAIDLFAMIDEFRSHPAVPCVSIGTYEQNFLDYVVVDLSTGVQKALEIMAEQGRQRIAYVVNAEYLTLRSEVRARTYMEFMEAADKPIEFVDAKTSILPLVRERLREYFETQGCPDALLCLNDEIAMIAYRVLRDMGKRIPEDVLLVGCDGQLHMEYFDPPLSTIVQPIEEMCVLAWQFLKSRMADPSIPLQQASIAGELVVTKSLLASATTASD